MNICAIHLIFRYTYTVKKYSVTVTPVFGVNSLCKIGTFFGVKIIGVIVTLKIVSL